WGGGGGGQHQTGAGADVHGRHPEILPHRGALFGRVPKRPPPRHFQKLEPALGIAVDERAQRGPEDVAVALAREILELGQAERLVGRVNQALEDRRQAVARDQRGRLGRAGPRERAHHGGPILRGRRLLGTSIGGRLGIELALGRFAQRLLSVGPRGQLVEVVIVWLAHPEYSSAWKLRRAASRSAAARVM